MSTERTGEKLQDSFKVEMRYNSEFLYRFLTRDNKSSSIRLDNNWRDIVDPEYDLYPHMEVWIDSLLLVTFFPDYPDRVARAMIINAFTPKEHYIYKDFQIDGIMEYFSRRGLYLCKTGKRAVDSLGRRKTGLVQDSNPGKFMLLLTKEEAFGDGEPHWEGTIEILVPNPEVFGIGQEKRWDVRYNEPGPSRWVYRYYRRTGADKPSSFDDIQLTGPNDIQRGLDLTADLIEKNLKFWYGLKKRQLPLNLLLFTPDLSDKEKSQMYMATCSYCSSNYLLVKGLSCPNCGASRPEFK